MVDVDHFKLFNDRYGHPDGDVCLRRVAAALHGAARRPVDVVARHGGEEFALLLPETPRVGAEHVASRILAAIASLDLAHAASPTSPRVTVSVGVSSRGERHAYAGNVSQMPPPAPGRALTEGDLVQRADTALYQAKRGGRDQARWLGLEPTETTPAALVPRTA